MCLLKKSNLIGIVACSNGQPLTNKTKIDLLIENLKNLGLDTI